MGNGPYKGTADYLELGTYNAVCSLCGRKRKANQLERNWMGLYRCPEHNEPRQPQDFVRNIPDIMTVPWGQPQEVAFVPSGGVTFPLSITPQGLVLAAGAVDLSTEIGDILFTESGIDIITESAYAGVAQGILPAWIVPVSFSWTWKSGGGGITIDGNTTLQATFTEMTAGNSGVAQLRVVDNLGSQAIAYLTVTG